MPCEEHGRTKRVDITVLHAVMSRRVATLWELRQQLLTMHGHTEACQQQQGNSHQEEQQRHPPLLLQIAAPADESASSDPECEYKLQAVGLLSSPTVRQYFSHSGMHAIPQVWLAHLLLRGVVFVACTLAMICQDAVIHS